LLASRIKGGSKLHFPPLPATSPLAAEYELVEIVSAPVLYSYTILHPGPKSAKPPTALGLVDFPEGLRVFGRLIFPPDRRPMIGERLRACIIDMEDGPIFAFCPAEADA